jgi:tape measure domain-containing protein
MQFNNAQFEQGIKQTLASLEALQKSLKLDNATKGLSDVSAAAQHVQLGHISSAVDGISDRFKAMSVVAITALATIAHEAVAAGLTFAKSFTVGPLVQGLQEYQTNINSIQTILSNTRWQNTGLDQVNAALKTLNDYSDLTIYNFSQMARNIGTFTAAGVSLEVATGAIKGIANLAAVSGSNAEQASMAMYQLSQALATGTVKLIDWNSVVNAGMGGKVFQDALMNTARVHGVAIDQMLKDAGSFRATLENGWLSAQILTETLQQFTGDLTKEQVISMGYTAEQADAIIAMGKDAQDAATKVKTITQLFSTLQESAGSGWAQTWQLIFGDFEEARTFFTDVNDILGAFIKTSADSRNAILSQWKDLGGRTALIQSLLNVFTAVERVVKSVGQGFREMFPRATGEQLAGITHSIEKFTSWLIMSEETMDKVRRTAAGFFAILGIGWDILKLVSQTIFDLIGQLTNGDGKFLDITASIGDFLVALRTSIKEGNGLVLLFRKIEQILIVPIKLFQALTAAVSDLFASFDPQAAGDAVSGWVKHLGPLGTLMDFIVYVWKSWSHIISEVAQKMFPFASALADRFREAAEAMGGLNFDTFLKTINTGTLISLVVTLRNTFGHGGITGMVGELTSTLNAMQSTLHATTLLEIAAAIAILAVGISMLSKIDSEGLTKALSAIAVMFAQLLAAMVILTQLPSTNVIKLYVTAAAVTVLATAIDILVIAVRALSSLSWEELIKGLTGVGVLLLALTTAANFLPDGARLISTGLGLLVVAAGVKVLASAVSDLSGFSWEELAKGLSAVGVLLTELTLFSRFAAANTMGVLGGAGILLLAAGIKILASAVLDLSGISWENIGKGMAVLGTSLALMAIGLNAIPPTAPLSATGVAIVAASMLILAEAMKSMSGISWENVGKGMTILAAGLTLIAAALIVIPPYAPLSAAGVLIVAVALNILADALQQMGGMSWEAIAKGLVTLGVSLGIIVAALLLMPSALPGAVALLIVSNALLILSGVLKVLGGMSWGEIVKGLVTLAAAFAVLGVAAALLTPVIPGMLGLGAALFLIGAGLALVGAGVFLFATGLTALSVAGAAGTAAIVALVSAVLGLVPAIVKMVGVVLLTVIDFLIDATPKIVKLILDILVQLLDGIVKMAPSLENALIALIDLLLNVLEDGAPKMASTAFFLLIAFLSAIKNNIYRVVDVAADIIVNFLRALQDAQPRLIQAGIDFILAYIHGLATAIRDNSAAMGDAGADLALAIIEGMARGLWSGGSRVADAARGVAKSALAAAMNFLGINSPSREFMAVGKFSAQGIAVGLANSEGTVNSAAEGVANGALETMREALSKIPEIFRTDPVLTPVISPVLDLTQISKDSGKISRLMTIKPLTLDSSYKAAQITGQTILDAANQNPDEGGIGGVTNNFNYTQNNTSPRALDSATIYRQTKNQISTLKKGVASANEVGSSN